MLCSLTQAMVMLTTTRGPWGTKNLNFPIGIIIPIIYSQDVIILGARNSLVEKQKDPSMIFSLSLF